MAISTCLTLILSPVGTKNVVSRRHVEKLKSGCILANMGHSAQEIDLESFKCFPREKIRKNVSHIHLPNNKRIFLLADVSGCPSVNSENGF